MTTRRSFDVRYEEAAFTYVEVLVALTVVAVMVGAVCSALTATLRAEETAKWMTEAQFIIVKMAAEHELHGHQTGALSVANSSWDIKEATFEIEASRDDKTWTLVEFSPTERPALHIEVAFDAGSAR